MRLTPEMLAAGRSSGVGRSRTPRGWLVIVFVAALIPRLTIVLRGGGFFGNYSYDSAVYYAAAAALTHGKVPYREDFVLVHPPMVAYVLTPFAWVGHLMSDSAGYISANLAFTILGAANAVLVVVIARRLGLPLGAAMSGGLFYGVWFGSVEAEYLTRLEPLGNFFVLCALLALVTSWDRTGRWLPCLSGAALALALSVKIWWGVPVVVLLLWQLIARRSPQSAAWMVTGGAVAAVGVNAAPFLLSRGAMWSMVVTAQLGRNETGAPPLIRLGDLTTIRQAMPQLRHGELLVLVGVLSVAAVVTCLLALLTRQTRVFVLLLLAQLAVLLVSPSWFRFYTDYLAGAAALTVAGASAALTADQRPRWARLRRALAWGPTTVAGLLTIVSSVMSGAAFVVPVPHHAELAHAARAFPCIVSDMPMALIELDALDRSFAPGCQNWVDPTGRILGAGKAADRVVRGRHNPVWSQDLADYLMSGDAALPVRKTIGLTGDGRRAIQRGGVIVSYDGYTLYRVVR